MVREFIRTIEIKYNKFWGWFIIRHQFSTPVLSILVTSGSSNLGRFLKWVTITSVAPFTLLISGPVQSRFGDQTTLLSLIEAFIFVKRLNPANQIVLSTYEGEVPPELLNFVDKVILISDPGPDYFRVNPWPIGNGSGNQSANISRMLQSTVSGLNQTQTPLVIKTRVELVPENLTLFETWSGDCSKIILGSESPAIGFFLEHYSGISFSINGLLGIIPDTLQFGRTETLKQVWSSSDYFWQKNFKVLTRKSIRFPITSEQILGLNFLYLYCNFPLENELYRLRRNYKSIKLVQSLVVAERKYFKWSSYKTSGLSANYLKGTLGINIERFQYLDSFHIICKMLFQVYCRAIYHHFRRYFQGFQRFQRNKQ
jgi:hypothetical protein